LNTRKAICLCSRRRLLHSTASEPEDDAISLPVKFANILGIGQAPFDEDATAHPRHDTITDASGKSNAEAASPAVSGITTSPSSEGTPENDDTPENGGANENDNTQRILLGNPMLAYRGSKL
jgi:hypothetical protein